MVNDLLYKTEKGQTAGKEMRFTQIASNSSESFIFFAKVQKIKATEKIRTEGENIEDWIILFAQEHALSGDFTPDNYSTNGISS